MKKRRGKMLAVSLISAMLISLLPIGQEQIWAGTWDNAYTYFNRYENDVVFHSFSETDGDIFCATKAAKASTNIKYRTIGWKVSIQTLSGSSLQTLYFKLGGSYMYHVDTRTKSNYEYNLYSLPLNNLKRRLNTKATKALERGDCRLILDACMIVVNNGKAKGAMNDSGPTSGNVYTTYSGISQAANWSSSAKRSFSNYFDKPVQGLFFQVQSRGDKGIVSTSGDGYYCYGTFVTLCATVKKGYDFDMWTGDSGRYAYSEASFNVTRDERWNAKTRPKELQIIFHRNLTENDKTTEWQKVQYGKEGNCFIETGWRQKDAKLLGWAFSPNASRPDYQVHAGVKDSWILKYYPRVELYAVWERSEPLPNPINPTPNPVNPTPDPVIPTPDPVIPTPDPVPDSVTPTPNPVHPNQDPESENPEDSKVIHLRFISSRYFEDDNQNLISEEMGGLSADSRWRFDPLLRQMLRQVLNSCGN